MNKHVVSCCVLFAASLASCPAPEEPKTPEYDVTVFPPLPDAGDAELPPVASCVSACAAISRLGCPEAAIAGRTCNSVCAAAISNGFDLRLACLSAATTVEAVRACCPRLEPCTRVACEKK